MAKVQPGRYTADLDSEVVLFLIGMRFNKPWKVWRWWGAFVGMPRMLRKLKAEPSLGLLHVQGGLISGRPLQVCYFASLDHLFRFAKDPTWRTSSRGGASTARCGTPATSASGTRRTA